MTWRALPTLSTNLYCWDDECVVFNHLSGDTHLLSAPAGQILLQLQQVGMPADGSSDAVMQRCAAAPGSAPVPGVDADDILADLNALALVERA